MYAIDEQRLVPSLLELNIIAEQIGNGGFFHLQYLYTISCLGRAFGVCLEGEVERINDAAYASCEVEVIKLLTH